MIDWTKPLQTRDGREVRIYARDGHGGWPIHGAVKANDGKWLISSWTQRGSQHGIGVSAPYDLVNVPVPIKISGYVNIYPDEAKAARFRGSQVGLTGVVGPCFGALHPTQESARSGARTWGQAIAIAVPVTIETVEGFGLPPAKAEEAASAPSSGTGQGSCTGNVMFCRDRMHCRLMSGHDGPHNWREVKP